MDPVKPRNNFSLRRASPADIAEITRLQYKCFPPAVQELLMGCKSEDDLPRITEVYERQMAADLNDVWIKVEDGETGSVVAASNWRVYPNGAPDSAADEAPAWLEGEAAEKSRKIFDLMNAARRKANPGGFVHLHIFFTDPAYRRRGVGSMMMQWGVSLAETLFVPAWVEASPEGRKLYERFGFRDVGASAPGVMEGTNMRRDLVGPVRMSLLHAAQAARKRPRTESRV